MATWVADWFRDRFIDLHLQLHRTYTLLTRTCSLLMRFQGYIIGALANVHLTDRLGFGKV